MVDATDVKFYKSGGGGIGLGGAISGTEIISGTTNNFFPNITRAQQVSGEDFYLAMYMKNTSAEVMKDTAFWLTQDTPTHLTTVKYGQDDNGSVLAQTIADIFTEPVGINWRSVGNQDTAIEFGTLDPGEAKAIWLWWHVEPNAPDTTNDRAIFNYRLVITTTGTGSGGQSGGGGGGGSGGNPPNSGTIDNFKIAAVGDWGEENETDDVVDQIVDGDYGLVIGLGDYSYTSSDSEWFNNVVDSIDDIFKVMANGNHDNGSTIESHLGVSNTHYSFDYQNVHILVLDTEKDMDSGSAQHTFAEADLERQAARANIDWIFVAFHRPMLGPNSDHDVNEENQIENYMEMFLDNGVNLVLHGHNHHWFRSFPVEHAGGGSVSIVDGGNGPYTVGDPDPWLIAATSGTGGHDSPGSLYPLDSEPSYSAYQNNSNNGILSIEASNNGQTLTCRFINTAGSIKHSWIMQKG